MLFGLALIACVSVLALDNVMSKLRADLAEFDSTIEKLDRRATRRKGR